MRRYPFGARKVVEKTTKTVEIPAQGEPRGGQGSFLTNNVNS